MIKSRALESDLGLNPGLSYWIWAFFKKKHFVPKLPYLEKEDNNL